MERRIYNTKGFSLIEIIAALAILATVAAISLPGIFSQLSAARERAAISDMKELHRAIVGNPELGTFGFLGDMGKLPDTLKDLIVKPTGAPDFNHNHTNRVGMGWRGPYVNGFSEDDVIRDKWGTLYQHSPTGPNAGQIISGGPDHDLTTKTDNIVFPAYPPKTKGTLLVTVLVNGLPQPKYVTVEVYQTENGSEISPTVLNRFTKGTGTGTDGYDTFDFEVTQGIHAVNIYHKKEDTSKVTSRTINVAIPAGEQVNAIINLTTSFPVEF